MFFGIYKYIYVDIFSEVYKEEIILLIIIFGFVVEYEVYIKMLSQLAKNINKMILKICDFGFLHRHISGR
jgi:hypothetical protein